MQLDSLISETASPRTHKPKIVNESLVSVTSEKFDIFFTVEKYQFYSHSICIEFTACYKIINMINRKCPEVIKLELILKLKIKCNDWLLVEFEFETVFKFYSLGAQETSAKAISTKVSSAPFNIFLVENARLYPLILIKVLIRLGPSWINWFF